MNPAIESLINDTLDGVSVTRAERIEPWFVWRVHLDGEPGSVIVKRLREHPDGFRIDPAQVDTEIAALQFVERLGLDLSPRVHASDRSAQVIVLEDLHPRVPLPEVLVADAAWGDDALLDFAGALGTLNAATAGRDASFEAPVVAAMSPEEREIALWRETLAFVEDFGVPVPSGVTADIATMFDELADPGAFLALSNGDPGTNNFLVAPDLTGKLIDFEFARFRHALMDAVHFYVHSPQWVTLPDPGPMETAYRDVLSTTVPEALDDDRFGAGMTAACLSYALVRLHRLVKLAARSTGDLSRLQLVATLESAGHVAAGRSQLRELGGWCADIAAAIRKRWRDTDIDLAALPAWLARDERSERIIETTREVAYGA